ncbi:hypothetical protein VTN00DRAFT_179 [Thermoascus crustaceus]|uniref:uncharacterized protein n=1 Tax=Thermoascus crustaceus TaxID=5088 RepID=UPI0037423352
MIISDSSNDNALDSSINTEKQCQHAPIPKRIQNTVQSHGNKNRPAPPRNTRLRRWAREAFNLIENNQIKTEKRICSKQGNLMPEDQVSSRWYHTRMICGHVKSPKETCHVLKLRLSIIKSTNATCAGMR